jgi:hypothetical protein
MIRHILEIRKKNSRLSESLKIPGILVHKNPRWAKSQDFDRFRTSDVCHALIRPIALPTRVFDIDRPGVQIYAEDILDSFWKWAMELRHVRYFLAVAEERNFSRAAARVGIGQPPLSQQIKDLEAEVGAPLFHRIPQGAELTAAGHAFLENVRAIPLQAERAIRAARRGARGEIGSLRVGFTSSAPFNPVVTSTIRSFRRAYPDVDLTLEEANTTRLVAGLRDGELDAVFLR